VGGAAAEASHERDAAGVVIEPGVIQTLERWPGAHLFAYVPVVWLNGQPYRKGQVGVRCETVLHCFCEEHHRDSFRRRLPRRTHPRSRARHIDQRTGRRLSELPLW